MTHVPSYTTFVELIAADARPTLLALAAQLSQLHSFHHYDLLESVEQPELWLLVCHSSEPLDLQAPDKARVWRFQRHQT